MANHAPPGTCRAQAPPAPVALAREGRHVRRGQEGEAVGAVAAGDISRFFPRIDRIFSGEALNSFYGAQDEGFSEFRSR